MRNQIIIEFASMIKAIKSIEKFKKLEFKYYSINHSDKDSPLKAAITFLSNFINNLDEKSPFIYPLILIDSGNYVYGKENTYGYGLTNIDILKSHLQNVLPDIIITILDEEKNYMQANSNKLLGLLSLNLASKFLSFFQYYKIDKKIENKVTSSKLELILFLELFHELFGHEKGAYSQKKIIFAIPRISFMIKSKKNF